MPTKYKHRTIAIAASLCTGLIVSFGSASAASATPRSVGGVDHPSQVTGSASRYGTSAPLPKGVAAASPKAPTRDTGMTRIFAHNRAISRAAGLALQPPSPQGTPVVSNPGAATGFSGLSHLDQRLAGTGAYTNTQFSLEPPDQGLCVGNGFVIEPVNDAFAVYNESGTQLTATTALNQFYKRPPAVVRSTPPVFGDFLSDPKR